MSTRIAKQPQTVLSADQDTIARNLLEKEALLTDLSMSEQEVFILHNAEGKYGVFFVPAPIYSNIFAFCSTREKMVAALSLFKKFTEDDVKSIIWEKLVKVAKDLEDVDYLVRCDNIGKTTPEDRYPVQ